VKITLAYLKSTKLILKLRFHRSFLPLGDWGAHSAPLKVFFAGKTERAKTLMKNEFY
jgi:hypothetical protein